MQITLIFLDKHIEVLPLAEAKEKCRHMGGVIMDAETPDITTQGKLRTIIDRDTWLTERRKTPRNEQIQHLRAEA